MEKKLNKKDLINIFIRSNFLLGSFNFERMQAIGFCVSLLPALRKAGAGPECLKAVLTPSNRNWSVLKLYSELLREHQALGGR